MKYKSVLKSLTLFMLIICTVFASVFCVSAVDDVLPDDNSQVETQEKIPEETTPEPETEYIPEETEVPAEEETEAPPEDPEQTETEPYGNEDITEKLQDEPKEENRGENQQPVQSDTVVQKTLPTVVPTTEKRVVNKDDLTYGYVSWACVAAGILVLIIVFISIKSSGIKQSKRKRR